MQYREIDISKVRIHMQSSGDRHIEELAHVLTDQQIWTLSLYFQDAEREMAA